MLTLVKSLGSQNIFLWYKYMSSSPVEAFQDERCLQAPCQYFLREELMSTLSLGSRQISKCMAVIHWSLHLGLQTRATDRAAVGPTQLSLAEVTCLTADLTWSFSAGLKKRHAETSAWALLDAKSEGDEKLFWVPWRYLNATSTKVILHSVRWMRVFGNIFGV